jgi:2-succinyl-6-hydroxy-2,4-cyclohexadiene-1-carboxylate synthase
MTFQRRPDATLAYDVDGDGTPVTLLHGFTQRGDAWSELRAHVVGTHRWITVDLRGHGDTRTVSGASHSLEACAADVVALWDALGVLRSHLAGYSMGGRLALDVATEHPDRLRSLMVISAHAGLGDAERAQRRLTDEKLARDIEARGIDWFANYWGSLELFATLSERHPELVVDLHRMRLANNAQSLAMSLRGMGAGAMPQLWDLLHRVACPALVIAGGEDTRYVAFAERLGATLPNARVEIVPAAGHAVHLEQPAVVGRMLDAFLRGVDAEGPA